jgi:uncharacterized metal-binding protein
MANYIALELDRREVAEMSCIAGVGGDVPHLVRIALSGRPILAIDGCPFACVKSSLEKTGLTPSKHVRLHDKGVKKRYHTPFNPEDADRILGEVIVLAQSLSESPESAFNALNG